MGWHRETLDGRLLPDEPIIKHYLHESQPEYLCPHCVIVLPKAKALDQPRGRGGGESEEIPQSVRRHISECEGLEPYHLGLAARRKQKARWLAARAGAGDREEPEQVADE